MRKPVKAAGLMKEKGEMTFETLAKLTAAELRESMMIGGFKTLSEMCKSYWWGTNDLKKELMGIVETIARGHGCTAKLYPLETTVTIDDEEITYRAFSKMIRKYTDKGI